MLGLFLLLRSISVALKADLSAALNKVVSSLDEDNWKFEGPRSRINLISRPGSFFLLIPCPLKTLPSW
ncbi:Protein SAMBA [Linum grandiflorum]